MTLWRQASDPLSLLWILSTPAPRQDTFGTLQHFTVFCCCWWWWWCLLFVYLFVLSPVYLRIEIIWQLRLFSCAFLVFITLQMNTNIQMKWGNISKYLVSSMFRAESITLRKVNSVLNRIRNTMCGLSRWHRVAAMLRLPAGRLVIFFIF